MAFESLTERLQGVFKNLRRKGKLSEKEVLERLGGGASVEEKLPEAKHIFSHVEWQMKGYQIQVDAFYESSNVLVFATTLLGPEPDTDTEQGTTCPYLVIQTDYNPKHVITK